MGLARALVRDPDVLILDEPTSNMDVESERLVQMRLAPVVKDRTLILITHRLSMLRIVDRLIVMDAGKIIMDGPRDKVLRALQAGSAPAGKKPAQAEKPAAPRAEAAGAALRGGSAAPSRERAGDGKGPTVNLVRKMPPVSLRPAKPAEQAERPSVPPASAGTGAPSAAPAGNGGRPSVVVRSADAGKVADDTAAGNGRHSQKI